MGSSARGVTRITLLAILAALLVALGGATASNARADGPALAPIDDPAFNDELVQLLRGEGAYSDFVDTLAQDSTGQLQLELGDYFTAVEAAGEGPELGLALSSIAAPVAIAGGVAVAGYLTYKLVEHFSDGTVASKLIQFDPAKAFESAIPGTHIVGSTATWHPISGYDFTGPDGAQWYAMSVAPVGAWPAVLGSSTVTAVQGNSECYTESAGSFPYFPYCFQQPDFINPCTWCAESMTNAALVNQDAMAYFSDLPVGHWFSRPLGDWHFAGAPGHPANAIPPGASAGTRYWVVSATDLGRQLEPGVRAYHAYDGSTVDATASWTQDGSIVDPAGARAVLHQHPALAAQVNTALAAANPDPPLTLPSCDGQTYAGCVTLLQDAGVLGTISRVDLGTSVCPSSGCAGKVHSLDPAAGSRVLPSGDVNVSAEPDTGGGAAVGSIVLPDVDISSYTSPLEYQAEVIASNPTGTPIPQLNPVEVPEGDYWADPDAPACTVYAVELASGSTSLPSIEGDTLSPIPSSLRLILQPHTNVNGAQSDACDTTPVPPVGDPGAPVDTPPGGIDFGPLAALSPGCKFPYGFVCYARDVTRWFDVTPQAPEFAIPVSVNAPAVGFAWHDTYDVKLDVVDAYMVDIRTLEAIALWVGAVYLLATRLIGFRAGGDPGAAIDEASDLW